VVLCLEPYGLSQEDCWACHAPATPIRIRIRTDPGSRYFVLLPICTMGFLSMKRMNADSRSTTVAVARGVRGLGYTSPQRSSNSLRTYRPRDGSCPVRVNTRIRTEDTCPWRPVVPPRPDSSHLTAVAGFERSRMVVSVLTTNKAQEVVLLLLSAWYLWPLSIIGVVMN
jgi:hypothetical protein